VVAHGLDQLARIFLEPVPQLFGHARPGRRRDLDQLLVVALHRAVAFVKGEDVAVLVGDDLDFDVADGGQQALHIQPRVAERRLRQGRGLAEGLGRAAPR
jgi:hypothetical protein